MARRNESSYEAIVQSLLAGLTVRFDNAEFQQLNLKSLRSHLYREMRRLENTGVSYVKTLHIQDNPATGEWVLHMQNKNKYVPTFNIV